MGRSRQPDTGLKGNLPASTRRIRALLSSASLPATTQPDVPPPLSYFSDQNRTLPCDLPDNVVIFIVFDNSAWRHDCKPKRTFTEIKEQQSVWSELELMRLLC